MSYSRQPNIFTDPAGVRPTYRWTINHSSEEQLKKSRQLADGAPTSNIGLMPQQGAPLPLVPKWKGTIFTLGDLQEMLAWYQLCERQTIFLTDFTGSQYEVLISDFDVTRKPCAWNHRGQVPWTWEYDITFRVLRIISGEWAGVSV